MAEREIDQNMNIQRIVAAVISNLHALPSSNPSRVNSVNNTSNSGRFESSEHELRDAFAIPRNVGVAADGASTSSQDIEVVPSTSTSGSGPIRSLSAGYSRLQNYSQGRAKPRKEKEHSRSTTTGRFEKRDSQCQRRQGKQPTEQMSFKDVCLLPSPLYVTVPRMKAKAELIGQGLYVDAWSFDKTSKEEELRNSISSLFRERLVTDSGDEVGFEFVRSVGTEILPISLPEGQEISGRVIKHVTGSGPIYIRALKVLACLENKQSLCDDDDEDDDTDKELWQTSITTFIRPRLGSERESQLNDGEELPNPKRSKCEQTSCTDIRRQLHAMFPEAEENTIDTAISATSNVEEAVDALLIPNGNTTEVVVAEEVNDEDEEEDGELPPSFLEDEDWSKISIPLKMERLRSEKLTGPKFKLLIDQDDILNDAVAFYKSPCFDTTRPLRVSFNDQLAIDGGGVLREFFSTVKEKFITEGVFRMFEGPCERLLFHYEQSCHAAEIPKILGKIIAHSLIHDCGGFPHLAPSHYYYVATGDIQKAAAYASVYDVYDIEKRDILDKLISAKSNEELNDLKTSDYFISVTQESGLACLASIENKLRIAEAIVFYNVLVKKVVMLDSFAKGLELLGVLDEIRKNPSQFEEVFLHNDNELVSSVVLAKLIFLTEDAQMYAMLENFINNATKQELRSLLKFVSGIGNVPLTPITVEVTESPEIFASTCLIKLSLPAMLKTQNQDCFNSCIRAAIRVEGKAFTSY